MDSPPQNPNAIFQAPAGPSSYFPKGTFPPFTYARVPGGFVPIPQHIRPFLDTTHEPTEGGPIPNHKPNAQANVNLVDDYYYKIRRLSPVRHPATGRILSAYSGVELRPDSRFVGHQFDEYIFHAVRKSRLLMLRVEKQAALTSHRYPRGLESTKCRFAKCPINGTIRPGQIRVCISEFLDPHNEVLDPYHNAAYVHLYCLENFCNLPSLLAETNIPFLAAGQLAKESSFPPALNAAEREACLQWVVEARQSWKNFKRTYPIAEARPRYRPQLHERLYYRLGQIGKTNMATNKRRREDYDGPQVYTYVQGQQSSASEPAPKKIRTLPPRTPTPAAEPNSGPQIYHGVPMMPYQGPPPTSHPQACNNISNDPIDASLPLSPGNIFSDLADSAQNQIRGDSAEAPDPGLYYSTEEVDALMARDFTEYMESTFGEFAWHEPAIPLAAGPQEYITPEQGPRPEQPPQPVQSSPPVQIQQPERSQQPVATVKNPAVTAGRRVSRRLSAPPVLGVHNARVRKSSAAGRRSSRTKEVIVHKPGLGELHKGR